MALTTCPACQSDISDQANACPKCGQPLRKATRTPFGKFVKWGFIAFNVVMVLWLFSFWGHAGGVANQAGNDAERAGAAIGGMLGTGFLMFVWFFGFIIGALMVMMTRPAGASSGSIPVSDPNSGEGFQKTFSSTASTLKSSLMATAKTAGQLTAKQSEKVKLSTTMLKLYWKLGKHCLPSKVYREEFPEQFREIEKIQKELAQTAIHQQAKDNTFMEKAKATAGNALQSAQGSKLSVTQASLISRLGKAIYESHQDSSGPDELVAPIREGLSRMAVLDQEINELSGGVSSYVGRLSPRTKWTIAGVACFLILVIASSRKENRLKQATADSVTANAIEDSGTSPLPSKSNAKNEYRTGETFRLGDYKYKVIAGNPRSQIGNRFVSETPSPGAVFVVITYTIENCSNESQTVMSDDFSLLDSKGRTFTSSSNANVALMAESNDKDFVLSELQPGLPRTMQQGFEVPQNALESELTVVIPQKGFFSTEEAKVKVHVR